MANRPWMPIYWGDYLRDTMHLSTVQHGCYLLLIAAYWTRGGPIPNDPAQLARICRMSGRSFARLSPEVLAMFSCKDGLLRHERIEKELLRSSGRSAAGVRANSVRWSDRTPNHNHNHTELFGNTESLSEESSLNETVGQRGTNALTLSQENGVDLDAEFDEWWQLYPRKVGKKACKPKYVAARRKFGVSAEQMRSGLEAYIATKPHDRPWCHPLTWLNQGRWADEPEPTPISEAQAWLEKQT